MKTINLTIVKKGRVWFECKNSNNYSCKLKINEFSKDLSEGPHEILVEDISIRSKYGTELRYEMAGKKSEQKIFLCHPIFNAWFALECKKLGGIYDPETNSWVFSDLVKDKIELLEELYNGETVNVEITANDDLYKGCKPVTYLGYTIARATGRDSGASLGDEVYMISGKIRSGGSINNWSTEISKGSTFRLKVPKKLKIENEDENWTIREI